MQRQAYWLRLKITQPEAYAKLDKESRQKHRARRRTRAVNWNKLNKERRNLRRRLLYAQKKEA